MGLATYLLQNLLISNKMKAIFTE